jgi:hypothetical protein
MLQHRPAAPGVRPSGGWSQPASAAAGSAGLPRPIARKPPPRCSPAAPGPALPPAFLAPSNPAGFVFGDFGGGGGSRSDWIDATGDVFMGPGSGGAAAATDDGALRLGCVAADAAGAPARETE